MCFSIDKIGLVLHSIDDDPIGVCYKLFAENPGVILQFKREGKEQAIAYLTEQKILAHPIANIQNVPKFDWTYGTKKMSCDISALRRKWFETSYHFDKKQTKNNCADFRYANFDKQPLKFLFPGTHTGHLDIPQSNSQKPKAGILREQGSNSERELAHALFLAGFDVKDIHMTDLISGRETLTDIQFLGAVGGFSNSDVLGSAKGWAGSFKYNNKAKSALEAFFKREDTLTIGICNGCQLFMELGLITNDASRTEYMAHNRSGKHESNFISVSIPKNQSIMLSNLAGCTLGVWISHGEGRFVLPKAQQQYPIAGYYTYDEYPANPNGSDYNTAMLCSDDGRHLVSMPHIERSIFKWNWAYYDPNRPNDIISPWILAFKNAYQWIVANKRP